MANESVLTGLRSLGGDAHLSRVPPKPYPWKSRIATPAAIIFAVVAIAGWSARDALLPATDVRVVPVVLQPIASSAQSASATSESAAASVLTQAAGWIEPDPHAVAVSALADGTIREVLVLEGQRVQAGDVVVRLVDEDARLAVDTAKADLAARKAELTAARTRWDNPVERRRITAVARGSLAESKAELTKLDDDIAAERARAGELTELLNRTEKMTSSRAASDQELIVLRYRLQAQQAVLKATEARRAILEAIVDQRTAEVAAAEDNSRLRIEETLALESATAAVMQAEAALGEALLRLARMEVRAPSTGVVMNRLAEPGGKLVLGLDSPQSAYVARLYDPTKLQVRVDVPLADASKVGVGARAEITVEALPGQTLSGEVTRIVHEADIAKNTLQFKVRVIDPPDGLKPEMLARVKFVTSKAAATAGNAAVMSVGSHLPFVPASLVREDSSGTFLLVADRAAGIARVRSVTLGSDSKDGWTAVSSGLAAGDNIIAEPADLRDGARIRIVGEAVKLETKVGG